MRIALALLALLFAAELAYGQGGALDQVEQLMAAGNYAEARTALDRWWSDVAPTTPAERPRALLLRARLARDAAAAERDYLALVLEHPRAPEAAEALLRLGQANLAAGDAARAADYLERFAIDHPTNGNRAIGLLWLARARRALGQDRNACAALDNALKLPGSPEDLAAMIRTEHAEACAGAAPARGESAGPGAPTRPAAGTPARQTPETKPAAAAEAPRFTVQVGAFGRAAGAERLLAQLRRAGFDARVVYVQGKELARVRVGRFATEAEAEAHARRVRQAGFPAIVASDADQERPAR
ncbi:MAG TPA: SPOR domain-containing protein [Longimicrobiales bacterium]|nr:SPOR domain-containing protein [Longimicrobiales bacterium]